ncbi:hypothetical protein OAJ98_02240 [Deltaproteobacteria bacterium]|nr:hypothetical protein [Deltaproteobacteria bacterium]
MLDINNNSNGEVTRMMIADMTAKFLAEGNEITKIKDSKGQRGKVRFEHGFRRGRIGWFECK